MDPVPTSPPGEFSTPASPPPWAERITAVVEILLAALFCPLLTQSAFSLLRVDPFAHARALFAFLMVDATLTLVLIALLQRLRGESPRVLGIVIRGLGRESALGIAVVPFLFLSTMAVGFGFKAFLPQYFSDENPVLQLIRTPVDLTLFLFGSLYVGGLKEEIQRAFVLTRFEKGLGGAYVGLVLWSIFFALLHDVQGVDRAVAAGVLGFVFGLIFLRRRNVVSPVVAHASFDVITLLVYWLYFR